MDMPQNPLYIYAREVADNVKLIKESTKHTEDFKQQVIAEALHPDRVEYLINKHGIEDGMSTYD
jgi:transposase-like protein